MLIFSTSAITNAVIALLLANKHQEIFSSILLFMIKQKNVRDKMRYNNLINKLCSQARLCSSQARLCSSQAS